MQWYLTWGRPNGDEERCDEIPQVCTYEGMQDAVTETYSTYGCMFNPGQVAPAGEAFREYSFLLCLNKLEDVHKAIFCSVPVQKLMLRWILAT